MRIQPRRAAFIGIIAVAAVLFAAQPAQAFYFKLPPALEKAVQSLKSVARAQAASEMIIQPTEPAQVVQPIIGDDSGAAPSQPTEQRTDQPSREPQSSEATPVFQSENKKESPNNEQDNARHLLDIKRGARDLARQLNKFITLLTRFEKGGLMISDGVKTKVESLKTDIAKLQSITSPEEAEELDMNGMWNTMRELEEERQSLERMENITREMKRIESEIKRFSQQIAKLEKAKMTVPAGIKENVEKVKTKIAEIKGGQIENAEDIWDLMEEMNQDRQTLEMLSRWPQTLKDVNREIKRLEIELKKVKITVARLIKKGLDLSVNLEKFTAEVERVKAVKADAEAKMAAGEVEEALELLQNDFFGQLEDVWQEHKIIMTMSNLGQFNANFQREINQGKQEIKVLKRKKIDTTGVEEILNQAINKGNEVKTAMKTKPVDYENVITLMEELEDLGQEFDNLMAELRGDNVELPWEKGVPQFKEIKMSPTMEKFLPRKEAQPARQTCNINGVEVEGSCAEVESKIIAP
ncbi:MAG: hypothetical protein WC862_02540 [Patescibacteria group bacterium]